MQIFAMTVFDFWDWYDSVSDMMTVHYLVFIMYAVPVR